MTKLSKIIDQLIVEQFTTSDLGENMKRKEKNEKMSCAYLRLCELNNLIRANNQTLDKTHEIKLISIVLSEILDILDKM